MSSIMEIQQAIISLSKTDYAQLRHWLNEYDRAEWNRQIEADSDDGKLDFLMPGMTSWGGIRRMTTPSDGRLWCSRQT